MSTKFLGGQLGHWMKAIGISVVINSLMMLTGMLSSVTKSLRWLGWISDAIAAPPGLIIRSIMHLGGQSIQAYVIQAIGAFLCSIVFYAVFAWIVLLLLAHRSSSREHTR
jgi:hypothetical protein